MNRRFYGAMMILFSALGFGSMTIFAKLAYSAGMNVQTLLVFRFSVAALFFFFIVWFKYRKIRISMQQLFLLLILGGVLYSLVSTLYFTSVHYISPSLAALLLYMHPTMIALFTLITGHEKHGLRVVITIGISFAGVAMILCNSPISLDARGIALASGAALFYSGYVILGNCVIKEMHPLTISAYVTFFAALSLSVVGFITKNINFHFHPQALIYAATISLFSTILAIYTFLKGLEILGSTRASVIGMMEPLFAMVFTVVIFKEIVTPLQVVGGLAVVFGGILVVFRKNGS